MPSWNDGNAKGRIIDFVGKVTREGDPSFVPPAERIAVFDNDGTLWPEQPVYVQLAFALDEVKALAPEHPEWRGREPFASLLEGNAKAVIAGGEAAIEEIVEVTHSGMTTDDFSQSVRNWLDTARHPRLQKPYTRR